MAFFDKSIIFRNFQSPSTSDYHFRIYKTHDEDNMHMIELCDEANIKFIYRLRLTSKVMENVCRDNEIRSDNVLKYIQKFISELSNDKWLTCEITADSHCQINFYEVVKDLGEKRFFKISLMVVKDDEFNQYVIDMAEKYKKRYMDKKRENEGQKKKLESYEKKMQQLSKEVEEGNKLKKELKDLKENNERLDFRYERLKADFERQREEIAEYIHEKEELEEELVDIEDEADQLVEQRDKVKQDKERLEDEIEELEKKCKKLNAAVKELVAKGRKYEDKIVGYCEDIERLRHRLTEYEKAYKKLKSDYSELIKESTKKDNKIMALTNEIENLKIAEELKDKMIEEYEKAKRKLPTVAAATENVQPRTRQCSLYPNRNAPTFQIQKR